MSQTIYFSDILSLGFSHFIFIHSSVVSLKTCHWNIVLRKCEENLCDLCKKAHLRVKLTKNHSLVSLNKETLLWSSVCDF